MNLNDKYRIHNKRKSNKLLWIYLLIVLIFIFSCSLAKYISDSKIVFKANVAKWNIKVNGVEITQSTTKIKNEMNLIATENLSDDGLIKQGQKGYIDIQIDPKYTEVSLRYKLIVDMSGLPQGIKLTEYSLNDYNKKLEMPEDNIFEGEILLGGKDSLDVSDVKNYRLYWEWNEDNSDLINDNILSNDINKDVDTLDAKYKIKANLQIEQII